MVDLDKSIDELKVMIHKIACDNGLPSTVDIFMAILAGYEAGYSDATEFVKNKLDAK